MAGGVEDVGRERELVLEREDREQAAAVHMVLRRSTAHPGYGSFVPLVRSSRSSDQPCFCSRRPAPERSNFAEWPPLFLAALAAPV